MEEKYSKYLKYKNSRWNKDSQRESLLQKLNESNKPQSIAQILLEMNLEFA